MSYEASTMRFGTPAYTPIAPPPGYNNPNGAGGGNNYELPVTAAGVDVSGGDVVKRKRGRPRKYAPDGPTAAAAAAAESGGEFSSPVSSSGKRPRGRPRGSANKHQPAVSGSPGAGFMPHILDVKSGEDVLAKLTWFSQNSTRSLCILSASGSISNVTLQQTTTSGGTVAYEGRFEILSLCGSFMACEDGGRTGGLSVALSGPDGRVLGGNVAGLLTAASPVQVIVGSFIPVSPKQLKEKGGKDAEVVNGESPSDNSNPQGMMTAMPWS
ncbi:hypothetical protein OSB04_027459 [Centaurea solstitialis]|uniref:AT-hook motif nuclear-localized protein n=1 Tax=Centaurea solstitialis TaxID=347529 RepID=A0AA38SYV6_9ASTR|nr:hypothetical protein OSB04_027459 [Centaurea solstitialis]